MFAAGLLAQRFGGKRVVGWSVLAWSMFTLLTPSAATASITVLIAARIGLGVGEAGMYPSAFKLFGRWVPAAERGRAAALINSGTSAGSLIGLMSSGWLVQHYGWPAPFYVFGVIGLLWLIAWLQQVQDDPSADQRLGAEEHELLRTVQVATYVPARVRLRRLLLRRAVAGIVVGQLGFAWSLYVLMAWLPSYFRDVHGLSITHSGLFSAAPWLTMFAFSNVAGSVADWMIQRGMNVTTSRKLMQCGALLVSAALLLALHEAYSPGAALALLCGAAGALAFTSAGHMPAYLDVAPRHGALLFGFGNTFAQLPGIVGVAVTGWLVDITGTYSAAFVLTAIVSIVAALVFGLFVDARPIVG